MCGTYFEKIGQIGLQADLVEKRWLTAFIVTCKLGLAVGLSFFQLHVNSVIPCLRSLPTDVYFENCIAKPCQVGHHAFLDRHSYY